MAEPTGPQGPGNDNKAKPRPQITDYPEPSRDRPEDPTGYKPLSPFAIGGLVVGVAYAGYLTVSFLFSMVSKAPLISSPLTLIVPVGGLIVSLIGWAQVERSEGTRGGKSLALWGVGMSVLF